MLGKMPKWASVVFTPEGQAYTEADGIATLFYPTYAACQGPPTNYAARVDDVTKAFALTKATSMSFVMGVSGPQAVLSGEAGIARLNLDETEQFKGVPPLLSTDDMRELPGYVVTMAMETARSASDDKTRSNITGVYFDGNKMVATDGHRLDLRTHDGNYEPFLVRKNVFSHLTKDAPVKVYGNGYDVPLRAVEASTGNAVIVPVDSELQKYPNYMRVVPGHGGHWHSQHHYIDFDLPKKIPKGDLGMRSKLGDTVVQLVVYKDHKLVWETTVPKRAHASGDLEVWINPAYIDSKLGGVLMFCDDPLMPLQWGRLGSARVYVLMPMKVGHKFPTADGDCTPDVVAEPSDTLRRDDITYNDNNNNNNNKE